MTEYRINVYKIWWEDEPEDFYVGSSKKTYLSARMNQHRSNCRKGGTSKLFIKMREKGINTFQYVMLGWSMVSSFDEQRMVEQSYISRLNPTLNSRKAHITEEERKESHKVLHSNYYQANCEVIKEKRRDYNITHKEEQFEYNKVYRKEHKEEAAEYRHQYYAENQESLKARAIEYHQEHKEERNQNYKEWHHKTKGNRVCICGGTYDYGITSKRKRHYATPKHTQFLNALYEKLRG
jgi:hypothetical protein